MSECEQVGRHQLLAYKKFKFSAFEIKKFRDDLNVPTGKMKWKFLLDVYDRDQLLDSHLKQAPKLSYRA